MKKGFFCLLAAAVFLAGCKGSGPTGTQEAASLSSQAVLEAEESSVGALEAAGGSAGLQEPGEWLLTQEEQAAFGAFSLRFVQEAVAQAEGRENPLLSPASAYVVLLMTACGSDGVSREEFEALLGLPAERWEESGSAWVRFLNQEADGLAVRSANSVWMDEKAEVREEYLRQVSGSLRAEVFCAKLSSKEAMEAVNDWVCERTEGMIPGFRTEPYEEWVRLALFNALYLEARWREPFEARLTAEETFYAPDGEVQALFLRDFMGWRDYVQGEGVEGILLPYQNSGLAFLALRATDGRTPQKLLADLDLEELLALVASAERTQMDFSMPKMSVEYKQDLREVFWELGLCRTMTFGEADLSLMGSGADGAPLYIGDIQQAARLEVDEDGTRAAAVTEVAPEDGGAFMEEPLVLCLDSPYLYFVIDTQSGAPLFAGVMERPAQQDAGQSR